MVQPSMRITVDAAMRARDVSRPLPDGEQEPGNGPANGAGPGAGAPTSEPARRTRAAKNERRRLGKRGGQRPTPPNGA
ncbi:hypothetical protein GCM10022254_35050 [Actinomadura meridiana]|uniref:Uncharacterized protein n=1 Tax=Actinomadura meridiana TaxID=559626 RepID=A0ABP8C3X1_9ACTN